MSMARGPHLEWFAAAEVTVNRREAVASTFNGSTISVQGME
jgi:hypothetical protein